MDKIRALVTGATSGIGLEISKILVKKGYYVYLSGRNTQKLGELVSGFGGENASAVPSDLTKRSDVDMLCGLISEKKINTLVNCAGLGYVGESKDLDEKESETLAVNVLALRSLTNAFIISSSEANAPVKRLLNVSSMAGYAPSPLFAAYAASKSFVTAYTLALGEELRYSGAGITATAVCPGPVYTDFDRRAGAKVGRREMRADKCAGIAVSGMLRGKRLVVPGASMKILRFLLRFVPAGLVLRFERRMRSRE